MWDDMIGEMCGGIDHAPCSAGRAEPSAFAGEGDQMFVSAAIALYADEAMFEHAATQVGFELLADEAGEAGVGLLHRFEERSQVVLDQGIRVGLRLTDPRSMAVQGGI